MEAGSRWSDEWIVHVCPVARRYATLTMSAFLLNFKFRLELKCKTVLCLMGFVLVQDESAWRLILDVGSLKRCYQRTLGSRVLVST